MSDVNDLVQFVRDWSRRTDDRLHSELKRLGVGVTGALYNSVKSKVLELGAGKLAIELSFLDIGRLVDMGAGPGSVERQAPDLARIAALESPDVKRALLGLKKKKPRRAKKFYSKTVYSRFNALLGIISGSLVEEAVKVVREAASDPLGAAGDPYGDMAMFM